jgi:hypothetical protein
MKKYLLPFILLLPNAALASEKTEQRDAFVREVVVTLIREKAAHVTVDQHVETAFAAWQRYQELARNAK